MATKPLKEALNELLQERTATGEALEHLEYIRKKVEVDESYLTEEEIRYIRKMRHRVARRKGMRS